MAESTRPDPVQPGGNDLRLRPPLREYGNPAEAAAQLAPRGPCIVCGGDCLRFGDVPGEFIPLRHREYMTRTAFPVFDCRDPLAPLGLACREFDSYPLTSQQAAEPFSTVLARICIEAIDRCPELEEQARELAAHYRAMERRAR